MQPAVQVSSFGRISETRPIREIAMYENNGPLIRPTRRAVRRPFDPEGKECGCRGNAKGLLCDQAPGRPFGRPIVLDHRVPPRSGRTLAYRPTDSAAGRPVWLRARGGTPRSGHRSRLSGHGSFDVGSKLP